MYDNDDEKLPCGHTEKEHEEERSEFINDLMATARQVFGVDEPLKRDVAVRSARIFGEMMESGDGESLDLYFTVTATRPDEPIRITCRAVGRETGNIVQDHDVETIPGTVGNLELVMLLTGALATGLAQQEIAAEGITKFSA